MRINPRSLLLLFAVVLLALTGCRRSGRPEGNWVGRLKTPGGELTLAFRVTRDSAGRLAATIDSPDQGALGVIVDTILFDDGRLLLKVNQIQGLFEGTLSRDGSLLKGCWRQGPFSLPLTMKRADKVTTELKRPQEPKTPYPYREEEVAIPNPAAGLKLAGTLTLPDADGPFPAVVLITGSGAQNRDEEVFGHKPFLVIADYLTRRGIAVLRCDDRGVGRSTGDHQSATTQDFASDVLAQVRWLKSRQEIDPKRIGLLGHSEGGIIAPMVANQSKDVAFVILMAGTGLRGDSVLVLQVGLIAKAQGIDDSSVASITRNQRRVLDILLADKDSAATAAALRAAMAEIVASMGEMEKQAMRISAASIDQQIDVMMSPWFRYFVSYDPAPALRSLRIPVLAVVGERDVQVAPTENLTAIETALRTGGNKNYRVQVLPGLNHLFQTATTGAIAEYAKIEETIAPAALQLFGDWILATTGQR